MQFRSTRFLCSHAYYSTASAQKEYNRFIDHFTICRCPVITAKACCMGDEWPIREKRSVTDWVGGYWDERWAQEWMGYASTGRVD